MQILRAATGADPRYRAGVADVALQRMIADACLGARTDEELTRGLRDFLARHGVSAEDADALAAAPLRLPLYRRLIRNNLEHVIGQMMPRARARLNDAAGGAFDATVAAFLDEVGPRTHHLRDVPAELLTWARARWASDPTVPPWLIDLATFEHAEFLLGAAPTPAHEPPLDEVSLDRPVVLAEATRLVRFAHAVHELPAALDDRAEPEARAVALLGYRDADHEVRFMDLSPAAAAIVARLADGERVKDAIARACEELALPVDDALLAGTARLLADLGARGVLLGGARVD